MKNVLILLLSLIALIWDANPDTVTEYRIYEKLATGYVRVSPTVKITGTEFTLPTLSNAEHTFVVRAVNGVVESEDSNSVTIPKAPGKPTNLRKK